MGLRCAHRGLTLAQPLPGALRAQHLPVLQDKLHIKLELRRVCLVILLDFKGCVGLSPTIGALALW